MNLFLMGISKIPSNAGVLILEALAQASGLLVFKTSELCPPNESLYLFVGIDKARFKRPVVPGDQIELKVEMSKSRQGFAIFDAVASVENEVVASAELMCGLKNYRKIYRILFCQKSIQQQLLIPRMRFIQQWKLGHTLSWKKCND